MTKASVFARAAFLLFFLFTFSATINAQVPRQPQYVNMLEGARWPSTSNGTTTINVCWENPKGYESETAWVRDAVERTWQAEANLEFTGWGQCDAKSGGIRIAIKDGHPHTSGLGTQIDGVENGMELNFTFENFPCKKYTKENCIKFIAIHEFGHALGIAHEHNRQDCLCDEKPQGGDGGLYITSCDMNSVMNYCNERWNNYGILSEGDKTGIRTIYGSKVQKPVDNSSQGLVYITDGLGSGQLWENVYAELGISGQFFQVNGSNPTQTRGWNFPETGTYPYRVWSYTMHNEMVAGRMSQVPRWGYGQGSVNLEKGKINSLSLYIVEQPNSWNPAGYWNLTVKPTVEIKEPAKGASLKEIEFSFRSNMFDDTIKLANTFLQTTPDSKEAHAYLGISLLVKKDVDNAVAHLEQAILLGEPITLPVKRLREPLLGHAFDDASVTITANSIIVKSGKTFFQAGFSALSDFRIANYNNNCPIVFLKGTFVEASENSQKSKQGVKQFNLFPPSASLQPVQQGKLFYNLAVCNDEGIVTMGIMKTLYRVMAKQR